MGGAGGARPRGHGLGGQPDAAHERRGRDAGPHAPDDPAAGLGGRRRPGARVGPGVNALWVRERRIERVGRTATLHTELGSWPLRGGVVPDDVPGARGAEGPPAGRRSAEVQIARVLDDLYDASDAQLGPTWNGGVPTVAVWAPTARNVALRLRAQIKGSDPSTSRNRSEQACSYEHSVEGSDPRTHVRMTTGEARVAMERGDDGVWRVTGDASWRDAEYAFEVTVFAPSRRRGGDQRRHRPVLARADAQLDALGPGRARAAGRRGRSRRRADATPRSTSCTSATSRSATRPSRPSTAARTSPSPTSGATGCDTCARSPRPG